MRFAIKLNSPIPWTPDAESELLLRCCAVSGPLADGPTMRELTARGVDWNRFLSLANRNSVTPMIAARLGAEGAANLPRHVARALRLSYEVNALRSNHRAGCAVEIVDSFAAAACRRLQSRVRLSRLPPTVTSRCGCSEIWISWCGSRICRVRSRRSSESGTRRPSTVPM